MKKLFYIACLATMSAFAEKATINGETWGYTIVNGSACITFGYSSVAKLTIPSKIGKYPVTRVGEEKLEGGTPVFPMQGPSVIKIPNSVTALGEFALGGNDNLKSVTLPSALTSIPSALFLRCKSLSTVKIPSSVKSIGDEAFAQCEKLKSVTIPEGVEKIGRMVFRDCPMLDSITIPASVTDISDDAFVGCPKHTKISVSPKNKSYKSTSQALCSKDGKRLIFWWSKNSSAKKLVIPDGVEEIADWAFYYCEELTELTMPASVKELSWGVVACPKLLVVYTAPGAANQLKESLKAGNEGCNFPPQFDKLEKIEFKER